jgi:nucleotide-binding universal stress UspA family protein
VASLARQRDADLVIIGPHRPRPLIDHFSTHAAQRIARAAPTPLLVVNTLPSGPWSHILIASDLTETGDKALAFVGDRCFSRQAEILLFHGFEPLPGGFIGASGMTAGERNAELARSEREADEALLRAALKAGLEQARRIVRPLLQNPAASVVKAASDFGADLLVVGTKRRSGVERLLLGSVAEAAIREAGSDLLIIPAA